MMRVDRVPLAPSADEQLGAWQAEIDAIPEFRDRVMRGRRLFRQHNQSTNPTFRVVRATLRAMAGTLERCFYCDDSAGHQIDHFRPKSVYPRLIFAWSNFLFACGHCNQRKGERFGIVVRGEIVRVPARPALADPAPDEDPAIIDPCTENPLDHLELDLDGTFCLGPRTPDDTLSARRARHTIELLGLNERAGLIEARRAAFHGYRARTREYVRAKEGEHEHVDPERARLELGKLAHRFVWEEIKRARPTSFAATFQRAPELLET